MTDPSLLYVALPYDRGQSGISAYIRATLSELSQRQPLTLLALRRDLPELEACLAPGPHRLIPLANFWEQPVASLLLFAVILPGIVRRSGAQAVFVPAGNRRCLIAGSGRVVTTVHDLAPMRLPHKYDPLRQFYLNRVLPGLLRRAGQIVAISEQTRQDLAELTGITQVELALNGCDIQRFQPQAQPEDAPVLARHGLQSDNYLLYVARIEHPGKNHLGLIQAWQELSPAQRGQRELILAGSDWKGAEQVHERVRQIQPEGVRFLGYVPDGDLPALYRHACLYVQPSLYEGFGLPLVEAMASGTPVLSSDRGALAEVGGTAVRLVDPQAPGAMRDALAELLENAGHRARLRQAGLARASEFSWSRHGEILNRLLTQPVDLTLLGVSMFSGNRASALATIATRLAARRLTRLYFVNADCLNLACVDADYRQNLSQGDLCLPDGSGVALGAKITAQPAGDNLNGTDLFPTLCEMAQTQGLKVWFLGGRPGVAEAMVTHLRKRWPDLQIAGWEHGFTPLDAQPQLLERLRQDAPDILFVAMGAPAQEAWIQQHAAELGIPLLLGVGGLFDFFSGRIPRAPQWLRQLGLEWCWRLLQEPARLWRRYLIGNPLLIWRLLRYGRQNPCQKSPTGAKVGR